eukprot:2378829-Amphidinium_carterae.1
MAGFQHQHEQKDGRSESAGCPQPIHRAPTGAGRSSGRVAYRAQHDTRGCGEGFRYAYCMPYVQTR